MRFLAIMFGLMFVTSILSGCGDRPRPEIRYVTVNVPVPQPCVPATLGEAPDYPDTDAKLLAAVDAAERYLLIAAGRALRIARNNELETAVAGCPKVGQ